MRVSDLTSAQFQKYFEVRLANHRFRRSGSSYMALCPFHDNSDTPALSVNVDKGVWRCHSTCATGGGIIEFERKFSSCDSDATAVARIAEILGLPQIGLGNAPEAVYPYTDAFGKLLFQVVRYPGKRFTQRKPDPNSKGGWIYKTQDLKVVLYNLPRVVTAKQVIVCEGEKDCDNLTAAFGSTSGVAVTTSPRGAGKWQDEFAIYFAGKQAAVLPDNDEPGRKHADAIAHSLYRYTRQVKIVTLPGLPEKGDVSDYLKTHTAADVVEAIKAAPWWAPPQSETSLFMSVPQFEEKSASHIDWLLEGVIQRGANGLVIARPKAGKSFLVMDLALALASGQKFLDFFVPGRVKTALVSREDHGGLTQWREKKIRANRNLTAEELDGWLYINAKGLRPKIMLDAEDEVKALIADLKRYGTEFLILDVMRVLHGADENDNTEMQRVVSVLNRIQDEAGCSVCLVHHDNKREDATLTERARGASAIAGYAEWIAGIRVVEEENWTREFQCEIKASVAPEKFYWRILDTPENNINLERVEFTPPEKGKRRSRSESKSAEEEAPF